MLDLNDDERDDFFNLSLDMLCVSSGDGFFKWLNPAFSQTLGWSIEELLSKSYLEFVHPGDLEATTKEVQRQISAGNKVFHFENRYRHKDGSWRVLSWKSVPRGNLMYAVARDVTELNKLQQSLRDANADLEKRVATRTAALRSEIAERKKAEDNFKRLLEAAPDAVVIFDADRRIVRINSQAEQLFGYTRQEILGQAAEVLLPLPALGPQPLMGVDHFAAPMELVLDPQGRRKDGSTFPVEINAGALETDDGTIVLNAVRDITERKASEVQLRQAVKMEAVGQLTGGVAHDFNNLLGIIIGNLDIAAENSAGNVVVRESVEEALGGALRGAELTRRLLAFSRKQPLLPASIDLKAGLPRIADTLRQTLGEGITVRLVPGDGGWPVFADPEQLDEALLNLAINARDAMPGGGTISIETQNAHLDDDYAVHHAEVVAGDYVLLSVSDTGTGMAPEVIERCFEPFFTTKGTDKGTGLGLSMIYGFVKQSGGHIKVESEMGHGTTVKMYLPRADRQPVGAADATSNGGAPANGRELVLMVEDNKELRAVIVKHLLDLGYRTLEADNAKAALVELRANPEINLLFTDIIMPGGMTGAELAGEAKRLYPKLKILLTSGYTAQSMANGHDIEGLELLNKPFRKRDLDLKLRAVLEVK